MSSDFASLEVQPSDSIVSLRERLQAFRGRRVLLVWQDDGALQRKLDLVLIQREAHRRAIQLAIVAHNSSLRHYAAELNISCFPSVDASRGQRWKRGRHKVFLPRHHKPSPELGAQDLAVIRSRRKGRPAWRVIGERVLALALLAVAAGAAFAMLVPGAVVSIRLQEQDISLVIDIIADPKAASVDTARGLIPAATIRRAVETSASLPASGRIHLDSVSSAAAVTFTNLGDEQVDIPRGAILSTSAGAPILFETVADVVVPAGRGQRADGAVVAMESYRGSIGNVGPGMINTVFGDLAERVSALNLSPAAGGSSPSVKTVAAADQAKLLDLLRIQLQSLAYERMRRELGETQVIIIESLKIEEERKAWTRFSADVGTMTSQLSLTMRAVVSALAVDERYGRQLLLERLGAALPDDLLLQPDTLAFSRGAFSPAGTAGQFAFTVTGSARASAQLDLDELRSRLAGSSLEEARELLASQAAIATDSPPRISLFPSSWQRMPNLAIRIDMRLADDA